MTPALSNPPTVKRPSPIQRSASTFPETERLPFTSTSRAATLPLKSVVPLTRSVPMPAPPVMLLCPLTVISEAWTVPSKRAVPLTEMVPATTLPRMVAVPLICRASQVISVLTVPEPLTVTCPYVPPVTSPAPLIWTFGLLSLMTWTPPSCPRRT